MTKLARTKKRWTPEEDRDLTFAWSEMTNEQLVRKFQRPIRGIYHHAQIALRLPGVPQGMESVRAAAKRLGFTKNSLPAILKWAGVRPQISRGAWRVEGDVVRHRNVNASVATDAVEAWLKTASATEWARSKGINRGTMNSMLAHGRETGMIGPHLYIGRGYRLTEEQVDALAASYAERVRASNEQRLMRVPQLVVQRKKKQAARKRRNEAARKRREAQGVPP